MFTHHNNKNSVDLHLNTNNQKYDLATQDHANQITNFYKAIYQINDIILVLVFLVGSFFFFSDATMTLGTILFVIGSIQMTARPVISFIHDMKLSRYYHKRYIEEKNNSHT
ncbi:YrhK family protein [Staphylococcus pasteuri]|uniref:YrhK family protein n=1 Tax=Staphylococcus pasteuri TaxID=45972 RepID=UPI0037CF48E2